MRSVLNLRAAILSLLIFVLFVAIWHAATLPVEKAAGADPEYAKLLGGGEGGPANAGHDRADNLD